MFTAGDILELSYKHPTLGSGTWQIPSSEDGTYSPGGIQSNDDANSVTSNGEMIDTMNVKRWSFEITVAWDMQVRNELEQARKLAASSVPSDWTITHINGTVWGAKGKPVGEIKGNTNKGTMTVKLSGGGQLVQIQ